jgi:hypothetical protein
MSTTNRMPTSQPRFGFIPRPTAPAIQQAQTSSLIARSRSISPASTASANSSSSSSRISQRGNKNQTIPKPTSNRSVLPPSTTNASKPTISSRLRSNTPSKASTTSPSRSIPPVPPETTVAASPPPQTTTKTDMNVIRDRYKTQKRMNFFARPTPMTSSLKSRPPGSSAVKKEQTTSADCSPTDNQVKIHLFF